MSPKVTMMNTPMLQTIWNQRQADLSADKLEVFANDFYTARVLDINSHETEFHERMEDACRVAKSPSELRIPLWSYKTRFFLRTEEEQQTIVETAHIDYAYWCAERDATIHQEGWHSVVERDGMQPVPVRVLLRETDVLNRLTARMFGTTNFLITDHVTEHVEMSELNIEVKTRTLFLNYYPGGLSIAQMSPLHIAARKDAARVAPETPPASPGLTAIPPPLPGRSRHRAASFDVDEENPMPIWNGCFCGDCHADL